MGLVEASKQAIFIMTQSAYIPTPHTDILWPFCAITESPGPFLLQCSKKRSSVCFNLSAVLIKSNQILLFKLDIAHLYLLTS